MALAASSTAGREFALLDVLGWSAASPAARTPLISLHDAATGAADAVTTSFLLHVTAQQGRQPATGACASGVCVVSAEHALPHYAHTLRKLGASTDKLAAAQRFFFVDCCAAAADAAAAAGAGASAGGDSLSLSTPADPVAALAGLFARVVAAYKAWRDAHAPAAAAAASVGPAAPPAGSASPAASATATDSAASPAAAAAATSPASFSVLVDNVPAVAALFAEGRASLAVDFARACSRLCQQHGHAPGAVMVVTAAQPDDSAAPYVPAAEASVAPGPGWSLARATAAAETLLPGAAGLPANARGGSGGSAGGCAAMLAHASPLALELRPVDTGYSAEVTCVLTIARDAAAGAGGLGGGGARVAQEVHLAARPDGSVVCVGGGEMRRAAHRVA